jgi:hypothetical protein
MPRAYNPMQILAKRYNTIHWSEPWQDAFSTPEASGVWFVWGNSGNGKSSFVMQLVKELAPLGRVFYNSLEEGTSLTMANMLQRTNIAEVAKNVLIGQETIEELNERLLRRKAPQFIIIDSIQHCGITYPGYLKFKESHPGKLLIFISHAEGKQPASRTAKHVRYDADLKIHVEGFRATSMGRYNPGGKYTIWAEGEARYWGDAQETDNDYSNQ